MYAVLRKRRGEVCYKYCFNLIRNDNGCIQMCACAYVQIQIQIQMCCARGEARCVINVALIHHELFWLYIYIYRCVYAYVQIDRQIQTWRLILILIQIQIQMCCARGEARCVINVAFIYHELVWLCIDVCVCVCMDRYGYRYRCAAQEARRGVL